MTLTATEKKLLLLAFDQAAPAGEIASAGACLIKQLRKRFPDGYSLLAELDGSHASDGSKYGSTIWPFGKHRNRKLSEIDPSCLLWALDNVDTLNRYLRCAVERYLQDTQYAN
jgi:hypothetical protein